MEYFAQITALAALAVVAVQQILNLTSSHCTSQISTLSSQTYY